MTLLSEALQQENEEQQILIEHGWQLIGSQYMHPALTYPRFVSHINAIIIHKDMINLMENGYEYDRIH